jgi:hypothetical protein
LIFKTDVLRRSRVLRKVATNSKGPVKRISRGWEDDGRETTMATFLLRKETFLGDSKRNTRDWIT